eukprot:2157288-Prymnesium_polylepis.2
MLGESWLTMVSFASTTLGALTRSVFIAALNLRATVSHGSQPCTPIVSSMSECSCIASGRVSSVSSRRVSAPWAPRSAAARRAATSRQRI